MHLLHKAFVWRHSVQPVQVELDRVIILEGLCPPSHRICNHSSDQCVRLLNVVLMSANCSSILLALFPSDSTKLTRFTDISCDVKTITSTVP